MDKIIIKHQEFEGFLFDGKLESAVEILKEMKRFPHSTVMKCDMNIDPDMVNVLMHVYLVNGGLMYHANGQPLNVVYYQIGQGEVVVFADKIITVVNHKLLAPLGVMVGDKSAADLDIINQAVTDFDSFPDSFEDEDDFEQEEH